MEAARELAMFKFREEVKREDITVTNVAIVRDIDENKWPIDHRHYDKLKTEYLDNKRKEEEMRKTEELKYKQQQLEELKKELEKS